MGLTVAALGCGSNAPDGGRGPGSGGPGGSIPPSNTQPDAGAPPPTIDAGIPTPPPPADAGRPAPDAGAVGAYRYSSCLETMRCFQTANCYQSSCASACLNDSTPDIRDEASALLDCVEQNGCRDDYQCIGQNCVQQGSACGMAGGGTATCAQTLACASGCDRSDVGCYTGCLGSANQDARQKVQAIIGCAVQSGCGSDQTCILSRCGTQIAACMSS